MPRKACRREETCQGLARRTFRIPEGCRKANRAKSLLEAQREPRQDFARRTFKMSRKACRKANCARSLLEALPGGPSKCPGTLPQRNQWQEIAISPKASQEEHNARSLLAALRAHLENAPEPCHKENLANSLLEGRHGGPSKCPRLPTKRTVPGPRYRRSVLKHKEKRTSLQYLPEGLLQSKPCQELARGAARKTFKMSRKACHKAKPCQEIAESCMEDLQNVPESWPQREPCQDLARRALKMSRKAGQTEPRQGIAESLPQSKSCQELARGAVWTTFKIFRKACHEPC